MTLQYKVMYANMRLPTSSRGQLRHHEVSPSSRSVSRNWRQFGESASNRRIGAEETEGYRTLFGGLPYHMVSPPLQKGVGAVITPSPSILAPRSFLGRGGSSRWSSSSSRSRMPGLREKIDFTPPQGRSKENQEAFFSLFSYISFITPSSLPFT